MEIDSLFAETQAADSRAPHPLAAHRPSRHDNPDSYAVQRVSADRGPRQAGYVVTIMVLGLAVAALAVGVYQSRRSEQAWQVTAERRSSELDALQSQRDGLRRQLVDAEVALASAEESLAATREELDGATAQVKVLTDERAAMIDRTTFLPPAIAMATELAHAVSSCVLVLESGAPGAPALAPAGVDPGAIVTPGVDGDRPCERARADSEALAKWLGAQ